MKLRYFTKSVRELEITKPSDLNIMHPHLWLDDVESPMIGLATLSKSIFEITANNIEDAKYFVSNMDNVVQFPLPAGQDPKSHFNIVYESSTTHCLVFYYKKGTFYEVNEADKIKDIFFQTAKDTFPGTEGHPYLLKYNGKKFIHMCYWPRSIEIRFPEVFDYDTYNKTINKDFIFTQGFTQAEDISVGFKDVYPNESADDFLDRFAANLAAALNLELFKDYQSETETQKQFLAMSSSFLDPREDIEFDYDLRTSTIIEEIIPFVDGCSWDEKIIKKRDKLMSSNPCMCMPILMGQKE
jgi:hypothetical protein